MRLCDISLAHILGFWEPKLKYIEFCQQKKAWKLEENWQTCVNSTVRDKKGKLIFIIE